MKRFSTNTLSRSLRVLAVLICAWIVTILPANAQISAFTITPDGVKNNTEGMFPDDLFATKYLSADFFTAVFENGVPVMDRLIILTPQYEGLAGDFEMFNGYTGVWQFYKDGNTYASDDESITFAEIDCVSLSNMNGKKLYITGTCQNAYTGDQNNEGFIYITGNKGETVDIYLHDVNIKTQSKTLPNQSFNNWLKGYMVGNASPIAIGSTSDDTGLPFTAKFHIRGNNTLTGGATAEVAKYEDPDDAEMILNMLADVLYMSSASIAARPIARQDDGSDPNNVVMVGIDSYINIATKMTFDDIWPTAADGSTTTRTNGILDLPVEGDLGAPSIDLGNSKGQVEFNGGQYIFHTPRTNSMFYVSTLAICYRQMELSGITTIGVGSSMSAGSASEEVGTSSFKDVIFNDGTFSTHPAEVIAVNKKDNTPIDVLVRGWYNDYTDLRLPYNTRIYGGTFNNCEVYRCDGSGEMGVPPVYIDPVTFAQTPQCRQQIQVFDKEANGIAKILDGQISSADNWYNHSYMNPITEEGKDYVYMYLTDGCDPTPLVYKRNWVTLIPKMGVSGFLTMGGDQTVMEKTVDGTKTLTNKYLFYTRLNNYTKKHASISMAGISATVQQAINLGRGEDGDEAEFAEITNKNPYEITTGLYTMLSFNSNEWNMISLPYDVHKVYVIETTTTQFGKDPSAPNETLDQFLIRQGKADGNLAQNIVTSLCPDIFSGKGSGVNMNLIDIATKQINCPPIQLFPYGGIGTEGASHFMLYEQVTEVDSEGYGGDEKLATGAGFWHLENTAAGYSDKWKLTTPQASPYKDYEGNPVTVLMKKGRIYNIFFPAGKDRYWDGKYIIFEGFGPQTVQGSGLKQNFLTFDDMVIPSEDPNYYDYDMNMYALQANITFSNDTTSEGVFVPKSVRIPNGYGFEQTLEKAPAGTMIRPGQVYATTSATDYNTIQKISSKGVIRRNDVVTDNAVPTVGDILLRAYAQHSEIVLYSSAEQYVQIVSIDGRVIFSGDLHDGQEVRVPAYTGVFVVRSCDQAIKLLVE